VLLSVANGTELADTTCPAAIIQNMSLKLITVATGFAASTHSWLWPWRGVGSYCVADINAFERNHSFYYLLYKPITNVMEVGDFLNLCI